MYLYVRVEELIKSKSYSQKIKFCPEITSIYPNLPSLMDELTYGNKKPLFLENITCMVSCRSFCLKRNLF